MVASCLVVVKDIYGKRVYTKKIFPLTFRSPSPSCVLRVTAFITKKAWMQKIMHINIRQHPQPSITEPHN